MSGNYNRKDRLYQRAKQEGYRSRAAYKLLELNEKFGLFRQGIKVLDLGCFPGGWLQVSLEKVGSKGVVIGVDLKAVDKVSIQGREAKCIVGDVTKKEIQQEIRETLLALGGGERFDLMVSDMSPSLTGIRFQDAVRSAELVEMALSLSNELLREGGSLVAKIFPGPESDELAACFRRSFAKFKRVCLSASRQTSNEFYFVAQGRRGVLEG